MVAATGATSSRAGLRAAGLALAGVALLLLLGSGVLTLTGDGDGLAWSDRIAFLPLSAFAVVSGILLWKLPAHPIGWLLATFALIFGIIGTSDVLARTLTDRTAAEAAAWLSSWTWVLAIALLGLTMLVFPDGRLPSRRWAPVLVAGVGCLAGGLVLGAALWPYRHLDLLALGEAYPGRAGGVGRVVLPSSMLTFVAAVASLVARAVGGTRTIRLQLKWLLLAVTFLAVALVSAAVQDHYGVGHQAVSDVTGMLGLLTVPLAIGIAITRHRLYDIDRILSRTVAYTLVVSALGLVYVAAVIVLRAVSAPLAGGSDLAVAGSTLLAAALARPLHRRVRRSVDRRFDRSHYDAEVLIAGFAERSRRQVGGDQIVADLRTTAALAVQPSSVDVVVTGAAAR